MLCALTKIEKEGKEVEVCQVLYNVAYSYAIMRKAAQDVQRLENGSRMSEYSF